MKSDPNETDWRSSPITGSKDAAVMSSDDGKSIGENSGLGKARESRSGWSSFKVATRGAMDMGVFC